MKENIVLVDLDGVICDYNKELFKNNLLSPEEFYAETWKELNISVKRKKEIRNFVLQKGFWSKLDPIPGAIKGIKELKKMALQVYICSKPSVYSWCWSDKYEWIMKHMPFMKENVIFTRNKSLVYGSYFIDDSLKELSKWPHGRKILFHSNKAIQYSSLPNDVFRVTSWDEIVSFFQGGETI